MSIRNLSTASSDRPSWMECYAKIPNGGIYHRPDYIAVLESHYGDPAELFYFETSDGWVYYPFFRRCLDRLALKKYCDLDLSAFSDIVSSWYYGGPIIWSAGDDPCGRRNLIKGFLDAFRGYCRDTRIVSEFIRFDPNLNNHEPFEGHLPIRFDRETIYVDLSLPEAEIWRQYSGRCRTAVRKARQHQVAVDEVAASDFSGIFHAIYTAEMERKKAPSHYHFPAVFFSNLANGLGRRAAFFIVCFEGQPVGGSVCLYEPGGVAFDYLTASRPEFWKYQINNLLLHEIICWCRRQGVLEYDFHGGRDKVAFFKAAFSPLRRQFHVAEVVHDAAVYRRLAEAQEALSGPDWHPFFPIYRVKNTN